MHIELLLEEHSAKVALDNLLNTILSGLATFKSHTFQGKKDLLKMLPNRLRGYKHWIPDDWRIVVLY